jgi:hypothetical protein
MLEVHDLANSLCLSPIGIGAMAATKVQCMLPLFPAQHKEPPLCGGRSRHYWRLAPTRCSGFFDARTLVMLDPELPQCLAATSRSQSSN